MGLTYLQIGTWNIKHLGQQPTSDERSQSVFALTDHIEMAGVDVLALQELYVTHRKEGERRNEHMDKCCTYLKEHTAAVWKYVILENRNAEDSSQLCGVLWNDSIVNLESRHAVPVDHQVGRDWLWDRKPHAVKFVTQDEILGKKRSFVLVPLHMKANGRDSGAKRKRRKEAEQLARKIDWIIEKTGDESLILLGDTNCLGAWEKAVDILEDAGFDDLNSEDAGTYASSKGAPFDRFFMRRGRPEFRYSRQYVLSSANASAHNRYLSDHFLAKTSVKIFVDPS